MGTYQSIFEFNLFNRDQWVNEVASSLPAGTKILDAGAGSCPYQPLFKHCDYKTQDFIQLQPKQLRDGSGYGKIDYVSDINAIPVADESFDAVLCTEVMEHVPEPIRAIKEFSRILKHGGQLFLTAPLGSGIHQQPYHFYGGYTPYWYQKFLGENGFENIEIIPNSGFFKHYGQESIRFSQYLHPKGKTGAEKIVAFLIWLITYPFMRILLPVFCHYLERFDKQKHFTVGYHIKAVKK